MLFQGEDTVEDTENTEHDISAVASSLEGNPMTTRERDQNVIEEIMEQLLEQGGPNGNSGTMDIDDDANLAYDHERDATVSALKYSAVELGYIVIVGLGDFLTLL